MTKKQMTKSVQNNPAPEFPPRPLDDIDHLIIRYKIEHPGCTDIQTAKFMNLARHTIAERARNPRFQLQFAELTKPVTKVLNESAPLAAQVLKKHLNAKYKNAEGQMVDDVDAQIKSADIILKPFIAQKIKMEHSGDPEHPVMLKAVRDLSNDELRKIIESEQGRSSKRITG